MPLLEDYDRQQAFAAGFALAARDWGLDKTEYEAICKLAADIVPITDQKQVDQQRADTFVAQKAKALKPQAAPAAPPAAGAVKAAGVAPMSPPAPPPVPDNGPVSADPNGALAEGQRNIEQQRKADYERRRSILQAKLRKQEQQGIADLDRSFGGNRPGTTMAQTQALRQQNYYADMLARHPELANDPKSDPKLVAAAKATLAARPQPIGRTAPPDAPAPVAKTAPKVSPKATSPGALSPAISKWLKNPTLNP
jgi:hypothetical protein